MLRVRQTDERDFFTAPVLLKGGRRVGSNRDNFCAAAGKITVLIPQARQLRAAIGSHKAAQECQQNRLAAKIRQSNMIALYIVQLKIRSKISRSYQFTHLFFHLPQNIPEFISSKPQRRLIQMYQ